MNGRLPVRAHLRPKRRKSMLRRDELPPDLVGRYPERMRELNAVIMDVFVGPGRPGRGWDGWEVRDLWLEEAEAMPWAGEA